MKSAHLEEQTKPPSFALGKHSMRALEPADAENWFHYLADPEVLAHTSFPKMDLLAVRDLLQRNIDANNSATSCRWALTDSQDQLIGTCGFSSWSTEHRHAELVYDLSPAYWGQGLMRRAVDQALAWAFLTAGFTRVHAYVMTSNKRSIALLRRCGFSHEGTLRQYRVARGVASDFHVYALLSQDWRR